MDIEKLMIDNGIEPGDVLKKFNTSPRTALHWRKSPSKSTKKLIELLIWLVRLDEARKQLDKAKKTASSEQISTAS